MLAAPAAQFCRGDGIAPHAHLSYFLQLSSEAGQRARSGLSPVRLCFQVMVDASSNGLNLYPHCRAFQHRASGLKCWLWGCQAMAATLWCLVLLGLFSLCTAALKPEALPKATVFQASGSPATTTLSIVSIDATQTTTAVPGGLGSTQGRRLLSKPGQTARRWLQQTDDLLTQDAPRMASVQGMSPGNDLASRVVQKAEDLMSKPHKAAVQVHEGLTCTATCAVVPLASALAWPA